MGQVWRRDRYFGPVGSSVRRCEDRVGIFDAHRRPDRREVVGDGHACELVHGRKDRLCGHDMRRGWYAQLSDQVPEAGVVVHEQDLDDPERVASRRASAVEQGNELVDERFQRRLPPVHGHDDRHLVDVSLSRFLHVSTLTDAVAIAWRRWATVG